LHRLLCKKCDRVLAYVVNHGVLELMIDVYGFNFIITHS